MTGDDWNWMEMEHVRPCSPPLCCPECSIVRRWLRVLFGRWR